jgi:hypothetical protein
MTTGDVAPEGEEHRVRRSRGVRVRFEFGRTARTPLLFRCAFPRASRKLRGLRAAGSATPRMASLSKALGTAPEVRGCTLTCSCVTLTPV